ncbi:unnamed protein product [Clavelina lepadiformis]|uniref:proline--tRNA ligase n=1 Tax=Clavelina lepadiformis TaxID=159417 RepID=A0ABP0FED3_CLALP
MRQLVSKCFPLSLGGTHLQQNLISSARASESKSSNLLLQTGLISPSCAGMFHFLPPLLRSIKKLEALIDKHMLDIDGQKLQLSSLGPKWIWDKTGRWATFGDELLTTQVSGSHYCLSPTHEEAICSVMSQYLKQLSHVHLPIRLYQTTTKYRGEAKPHSGLLRCREFIMNDLYTFDVDEQSAATTYQSVCNMYDNIFRDLGVAVIKASAGTGVIGGVMSHEYHIKSDVGEDKVGFCEKSHQAWNLSNMTLDELPVDPEYIKEIKCIEVGHTFLLGSHYSKKLDVHYINKNQDTVACEMGCYGLGVSRIIAACLEAMSSENALRWPLALAPYKVCIIPPKSGSREESMNTDLVNELYDLLHNTTEFTDDVIIDDRTNRTIGWRAKHANLVGYPVTIVVGKTIMDTEPKLEVILQKEKDSTNYISVPDVVDYLKKQLCFRSNK